MESIVIESQGNAMLAAQTEAAMRLEDFDISSERGFLSRYNPAEVTLPAHLAPVRDFALALPRTLPTGRFRALCKELPALDLADFCKTASDAQLRTAMVHYSFLVQSYVWAEPDAPESLPANLAKPIWQLADALGQKPLLPYTAYVLDNWGLVDPEGPIDLSNIYMIQPFLAGQDEAWFVIVHVAIEARAGEMLAQIPSLLDAARRGDAGTIQSGLSAISAAWDDINAIFDRMPERCDPYVYFNRVRPWIHGWKDNPALGPGLIYEGVEETGGKPQAFRGQTGSQSSIVPTMDALFGIVHASDPLRAYLDELHEYRPPAHRRLIDHVRAESLLRPFIAGADRPALKALYNDCIGKLAQFRTKHLEYAASYINKQAKGEAGNDTEVGTGGTPFMKYLKKHRDEVQAQLLSDQL